MPLQIRFYQRKRNINQDIGYVIYHVTNISIYQLLLIIIYIYIYIYLLLN